MEATETTSPTVPETRFRFFRWEFTYRLDPTDQRHFERDAFLCEKWFQWLEWLLIQAAIYYATTQTKSIALELLYFMNYVFIMGYVSNFFYRHRFTPVFVTRPSTRHLIRILISGIPAILTHVFIASVVTGMQTH